MGSEFPMNIHIYQPQSRVCVLDPTLALSPCGIQFVQQLGRVLELWIAREFWEFVQQSNLRETLNSPEAVHPPQDIQVSAQIWQQLQEHIFPAELPLYWYGDRLWESHLPTGHPPQALGQWEMLAESLEKRLLLESWDGPLLRDTLALAATLPQSIVFTHQPQPSHPPRLCSLMEQAQLPCHQLPPNDPFAQLQRQMLKNFLVQAGLEPLQWKCGPLAILQLSLGDAIAVPALFTKNTHPPSGITPFAAEKITREAPLPADPWQTLHGFWQLL
jgi:hypothetical protein